jgi:hypothetical protein
MIHVRCAHCGAEAWTSNGACPDAAVKCATPAGDPPGSVDGCCSTLGHNHLEHVLHVIATGDASSRPVIITATASLEGSTG